MKNKLKKLLFLPLFVLTFMVCGTVQAQAKTISKVETNYKGALTVIPNVYVQQQYVDITYNDGSKETIPSYCFESNKLEYHTPTELSFINEETDAGYIYIANNGYRKGYAPFTGDATKDYYITQMALWWYTDLKNGVDDSVNGSLEALFKNGSYTGDSLVIHDKIKDFAYKALNYKKNNKVNPANSLSLSLTAKDKGKMTLNSNSYVGTVNYSVTSDAKLSYSVSSATGVNKSNVTITKNTGSLKVSVPVSKLNSYTGNITVSATATKQSANLYKSSNSAYQTMLIPTSKTLTKQVQLDYESTGKLIINKKDTEGKYIAGASFVLLTEKGSVVASWTSDGKSKVFDNLTPGKYIIAEAKAPNGYLKVEQTTVTVPVGQTVTKDIINTPIKLKIKKVDEKGKTIEGAHLKLFDSNDKLVDEWDSTTDWHVISPINPGTYKLIETKAPNGYVPLKKEMVITVTDKDEVQKYSVANYKTQVLISKQDITNGKELAGATLVLKDSTGKVIEKWVSTNEPHMINGLNPGKYTLTETIAPEGYILSSETVNFTVKEDGTVDEPVVMKNEPTKIEFYKKDSDTKELIAGATLVLKDEKGNIVDKWKTEKGKSHVVTHLIKGKKYILEEIEAPTGYEKAEKVEFIAAGVNNQKVDMLDKAIIVYVPDTADFAAATPYIFGMILIVAGAVGFAYNKKKYNA